MALLLEHKIIHAAGHLDTLHKHASVFAQARNQFEKGKPSNWSRKFFEIVDTRVASFREINAIHNDKHKYFCDYCSLPFCYPEQLLKCPDRIDGVCSCQSKWFETSLAKWISSAIPQWHQLMREVRSYIRRCKKDGKPFYSLLV